MILFCFSAVRAEVFLDREPPESWKEKDLLVLTPCEEQQYAVGLLKDAGIPYRQILNGETLEIGGASFRFLYFPDGHDPNALSSMAYIIFGSATLLMTGDITNASMRYLHANLAPGEIKADIMKFPHHAYTRAENEFIDDVEPKFVYITNRRKLTPMANTQLQVRGIPFKHMSLGRMTTDGNDWYVMQYPGVY